MKKFTTVLFKDKDNMYYIGTDEYTLPVGTITPPDYVSEDQLIEASPFSIDDTQYRINGFKNIQINMDTKNVSTFNQLKLNEFMILEVEEKGNNCKLTPLTIASLTAKMPAVDNLQINADLYELPPEKLLELFNGVLKNRQANV